MELSLYKAMNGQKKLEGILKGLEGDEIVITDDAENILRLQKKQVAKTKLVVVF